MSIITTVVVVGFTIGLALFPLWIGKQLFSNNYSIKKFLSSFQGLENLVSLRIRFFNIFPKH